MECVKIPGPAGMLEAKLALPTSQGPWAILCHPHPLYGGSMDDAVLDLARARFAAFGNGAVLFNFRGVGASEGRHGSGLGEVDDVIAVTRWLAETYAGDAPILVGYSFGSSVAWRAMARLDAAIHAVLIAPPVGSMAYPRIAGATATVIVGTEDPFVDDTALDEWIAAQPGSSLIAIHGADHFFGGYGKELAEALDKASIAARR